MDKGTKKRPLYKVILPESIIVWLKEIENTPPKIKGFKISRAEYLISLIITHKQDRHPGSYSILNMEYMSNVVPCASQYIKYFNNEGIIEYKNHSLGRNSRLYRITKQYDGHTCHKPIIDNELIRRIEKNIPKIKMRNSKKYPRLNKYVKNITIDLKEAYNTIEITYSEGIKINPEKAEARRTCSYAEVDKIASGLFYFKVNATNGRLDTNITGLVSECVPHLRFNNGNKLVELDIVNSQPFFLVALFDPSPAVERITIRTLGEKLTKYIKEMNLLQYEDANLYKSLVCPGKLYDYMMEQFTLNNIPFDNRDHLKDQLFTVFFAKNNSLLYSKAVKLFKSIFPNVYRLIEAIKEEDNSLLSILLTRFETYSMLESAVQEIVYEFPDLRFVTKHDSILIESTIKESDSNVTVSQVGIRSANLIQDVIGAVVGAKPQIKFKTPTSRKYSYLLDNMLQTSLS